MSAPEATANPADPVLECSKLAYFRLEALQGAAGNTQEQYLAVLVARAGIVLHAAVKARNADTIIKATAQFDMALLCFGALEHDPSAQEAP